MIQTSTYSDKEVFAIIAPSGRGKTTTLKLISGLERPSGGDVFVFGRSAHAYKPWERCVATVFQSRALFPGMSVWANIEFGLKVKISQGRANRENPGDIGKISSHRDRNVFYIIHPQNILLDGSGDCCVDAAFRVIETGQFYDMALLGMAGKNTLRVLIPHNLEFQFPSRGKAIPLSWNSHSTLVLED
uniref:ABC transporter n=1 Tax=Candidatus Kentrum sp. TC TaxID=2126339 RepID=A0A451AFB1_9GAMM|nr:MAG: ABC transporter [Candidatus Kentron sp. TC]